MIAYDPASRADATKAHSRDPDAEQVRPRFDIPGSQTVRLWIFGLKLDGNLINHGMAPDLKPVTSWRINEEHSLDNGRVTALPDRVLGWLAVIFAATCCPKLSGLFPLR
jgi:hypothetical protein